jgi:hypothetical protein
MTVIGNARSTRKILGNSKSLAEETDGFNDCMSCFDIRIHDIREQPTIRCSTQPGVRIVEGDTGEVSLLHGPNQRLRRALSRIMIHGVDSPFCA